MDNLTRLWNALHRVRTLEFTARSRSTKTGWTGTGSGAVMVESPTPETILLHESGIWYPATVKGLEFRNVYRWSRLDERVRLEHLRFGEEHPVYLFDLVSDSEVTWSSATPHLCREDEYTARLALTESGIDMDWTVVGPEKDVEIVYRYECDIP